MNWKIVSTYPSTSEVVKKLILLGDYHSTY